MASQPMVEVAQLVESRIVIPVVVGSSPIFHPTSKKSPNVHHSGFCLYDVSRANDDPET